MPLWYSRKKYHISDRITTVISHTYNFRNNLRDHGIEGNLLIKSFQ